MSEVYSVLVEIEIEVFCFFGLGSGIVVWVEMDKFRFGGDVLGKRGKLVEVVGREVVDEFIEVLKMGMVVDRFFGD